jgi:hypothetical protein
LRAEEAHRVREGEVAEIGPPDRRQPPARRPCGLAQWLLPRATARRPEWPGSRSREDGRRGLPIGPWRTARAGPALLFPLFYLVEIRHHSISFGHRHRPSALPAATRNENIMAILVSPIWQPDVMTSDLHLVSGAAK